MSEHSDGQFSTIAELLFLEAPNLNFARLVSDLDTVLSRFRSLERQLTWDYEDTASFDMPGTRIVLSTSENPRPDVAIALVISVGPSDIPQNDCAPMRHDALCSKLVERVRMRLNPDAVLWHDIQGVVSCDLLDNLAQEMSDISPMISEMSPLMSDISPRICERAPRMSDISPRNAMDHPIFGKVDDANIDALYATGFAITNDIPHLPPPRNPELARLRAALYPPEIAPALPQRASPQMRLAVHSMNATLIMVALPVGAALMTYSVLRGDNLRLTAHTLVATGFASTLLHSPLGQQMVAFAGI